MTEPPLIDSRMDSDKKIPPPADLTAPSLIALAGESRVALEAMNFFRKRNALSKFPRGNGQPIMIVPGFATGDANTWLMRQALSKLNFSVYGWELGINLGMTRRLRGELDARLRCIASELHTKVTLVGWSLGGTFVREMARTQPEHVAHVITLGSPINGHPDANNVTRISKMINPEKPVTVDMESFTRKIPAPPVPCTAIHTRYDGVVNWRCSQENEAENTENLEVKGSHFGLIVNRKVLEIIASRAARY